MRLSGWYGERCSKPPIDPVDTHVPLLPMAALLTACPSPGGPVPSGEDAEVGITW